MVKFIYSYSCNRLDGYHVVFGELVEGDETLRKIEAVASRSGKPA